MKNHKWMGTFYGAVALSLLSLSACQTARNLDPQRAAYQEKTNEALGKYANTISRAFTIAKQNLSGGGSRGFAGYGGGLSWNPWSSQPFGGYYTANAIDREMARCLQMIQGVPRRVETALLRLATLDRCTNVALQYRNPLATFGYNSLDPYGQYYWTFALNYPMPGTFNGFSSSAFGAWNQFAGVGMYQVPGYGF